MNLDALIIGGGIAGLWILDELHRRGRSCLLIEHRALGDGQTIWSQGIIHGGLKYTLSGLMNPAAQAIREMPDRWRRCLAGEAEPDLSSAPRRADHCHVWRTNSLRSQAAMIGAKIGLRVAPVTLEPEERPQALERCPGVVARLDEQVIDPARVLAAFATKHAERIALASLTHAHLRLDGVDAAILVGGIEHAIASRVLILAAGNGAGQLRTMLGLHAAKVQVRPLRMVLVRGPALTPLNGHCVDGAATRVTITSVTDSHGTLIWQVGGAIAELGPSMTADELIAHASRELIDVLPGIDLRHAEFAIYDAPRCEARTARGVRPDDAAIIDERPVLTVFPTKLALAPRAAEIAAELLEQIAPVPVQPRALPALTTRPPIATPPWERAEWRTVSA